MHFMVIVLNAINIVIRQPDVSQVSWINILSDKDHLCICHMIISNALGVTDMVIEKLIA